jgi:ribosome biogenesis GTPase / thiamine phosphate phosphatase
MNADTSTLEALGFNSFFATALAEATSEDLLPARVIAQYKHAYRVKCPQGEFLARVTGKRMYSASQREDYPAVGDWVLIALVDSEQATIETILPRQSMIKRTFGDKNRAGEKSDVQLIATNIDVGFIVESVDRDYSLNRFERYVAMLEAGGVQATIILNKTDLLFEVEKSEKIDELKNRFPEVAVLVTSTKLEGGVAAIASYIEAGKTYCFLGSSGVGKSSLINQLLGTDEIKTGEVSDYSDRGRHTTTGRQMYFLAGGGIVIDNPGTREVGMTETSEGLENLFDDIRALAAECKFVNCTHVHEPGCAVLAALAQGTIDKDQYTNYLTLKKETEYQNLNDVQKQQKGKSFGKFIGKAKKRLMR